MIVDKKKYGSPWRSKAKKEIRKRQQKAYEVMYKEKRDRALGQPVVEILRLMDAYPARFKATTEEFGADSSRSSGKMRIFDRTTKVKFEIYRDVLYDTCEYFTRTYWCRNVHYSETHPWLKEEEMDALCGAAQKISSSHKVEQARIAEEKCRRELEEGRRKMMVTYKLEG